MPHKRYLSIVEESGSEEEIQSENEEEEIQVEHPRQSQTGRGKGKMSGESSSYPQINHLTRGEQPPPHRKKATASRPGRVFKSKCG